MGELLRRRALMAASSGGAAPIDCPYITDGLIFWLDGLRKGDNTGIWPELVGGKDFTLIGATFTEKGIYFGNSTSNYGYYDGPVSEDFNNETIELAFNGFTSYQNNTIFSQPMVDGKVGASFIVGSDTVNTSMALDGVSRARWTGLKAAKTASVNMSYAVENGRALSKGSNDSWGANTSGRTFVSARTAGSANRFKNQIFCIRIYNRRLSVAEMQHNQAIDVERFGISY